MAFYTKDEFLDKYLLQLTLEDHPWLEYIKVSSTVGFVEIVINPKSVLANLSPDIVVDDKAFISVYHHKMYYYTSTDNFSFHVPSNHSWTPNDTVWVDERSEAEIR